MDQTYIIAVDIGGTRYRVALADTGANIVSRDAAPTRAHEGHETGLERIKETIQQVAAGMDFDRVRGIAVSAAGPLNPKTGVLLTPPSLPAWRNVPVKQFLAESFQIPVWVDNDADLAALGEQRFGAGRGCDRVIYITVSTGIGGGIILDGNILEGNDVSIAEIGHMVVDLNGPVCNCGGKGHLEPLASGTAIARIARERLQAGAASCLVREGGDDLPQLTAERVVEAARSGDALAVEVVSQAGSYLGMAIASLVHLFDPRVVIIGGGVANAGGLILEPVNNAIESRIMPDFAGRFRVVRAELGDNSGLMGAIAYGLDHIG